MINVDKSNPVWVVTLNRPDKANALTEQMLIDLRDTARDAKDARGLILTGEGIILTVSSGAAHNPLEGWSAYCASKAAAAMMTRSLHLEYGWHGISSMGLSPGTVATQMQRDIKASGMNPVSELDWSDHVPPSWPAKAMVYMCENAKKFAGQELALRDPDLRKAIGVA